MNIQSLTDSELSCKLQNLVLQERKLTTEILHHLREVERRRLYAQKGYPSLIAYCIAELKYGEAAAYRRIAAMRLLKEMPELEEKIQAGLLNLTTVAQTATFFNKVREQKKVAPTLEKKREVMASIENLSRREAEKVLVATEPTVNLKIEKQCVTAHGVHVNITFDDQTMAMFDEIQNLKGQKFNLKDLIQHLAEQELVRLKKQKGIIIKNREPKPHANASGQRRDHLIVTN